MAALSEQIVKPPTVDFLELLAAWRAVSFSTQLDYVQGVCEGNFGMKNSRGGHLIKDILSHSNSFQSISFAHVGWQGNAVKHALA